MRTRLALAATFMLGWAGPAAWGAATGTWTVATVDSAGDVGKCTALCLNSAGYPQIAYADYTSASLMKFAKYSGATWSTETVSTVDWYGGASSMKLDTNGYAVISYWDNARGYPTVVRWNGTAWSARDVVESDYGNSTCIVFNTNGNPWVSYVNYVSGLVKFAQKNAGTWTVQTVGSGTYTSLALGSDGNPAICYRTNTTYHPVLSRWNGTAWSASVVSATDMGNAPVLAMDRNGNPVIAYRDGYTAYLRLAKWNGSSWDVSTVDTANSGASISLAIDRNNNPHVAYDTLEVDGKVKYARWTGAAWEKVTLASNGDTSGGLFGYVSLALNQRDEAFISFYDIPNKDLKLARYFAPPSGTVISLR